MLKFGTFNWMDVPTLGQLAHIPDFNLPNELRNHIEKYHQLPKAQLDTIALRRSVLRKITFLCSSSNIKSSQEIEAIKHIGKISTTKEKYLGALAKLFHTGILVEDGRIYDSNLIKNHFTDFSNKRYRPLVMNNTVFFNTASQNLWGEYWLEAVDPCHRQLDNQKDIWRTKENSEKPTPFFLWLENNAHLQDVSIKYLNRYERKEFGLKIGNGKLIKPILGAPTIPFSTDNKEENIFIISAEESIFSLPATKSLRHVSLSNGRAIVGAGVMKVSDGELTAIDSDSGHYLPDQNQALQLLNVLKDIGLKFSNDIPFGFFENFKRNEITVGNFFNDNKARIITIGNPSPK